MDENTNQDSAMETTNSIYNNYSSCCRLCLMDNSNSLKPIFDDEMDGDQIIVEKIFDFLGIEVSIDDKLSTMICLICIDKMETWHNYKISCCENQTKLQGWLNEMDPHDDKSVSNGRYTPGMDHLQPELEYAGSDDIHIKSEPIDEDEDDDDMYELPPSLTPHPPELNTFEDIPNGSMSINETDSQSGEIEPNKYDIPSRKCTICNKIFSTPGNRRKHEKTIHKINISLLKNITITGVVDEDSHNSGAMSDHSSNEDDKSIEDNSEKKQKEQVEDVEANEKTEYTETDIQKIQFAAGLQLKQRNGTTPTNISTLMGEGPLTKVEEAYKIKCRKMITMFSTLVCSCHGYQHKTTKRLFAHLRSLCSWFPVYTCYNCVITYIDRSSNMRHTSRCPKKYLENLIKLSEIKRMPDFRHRAYQFYKCVKCTYVYGFWDDYCDHVDAEHDADELPVTCSCGKEFNDANEYRQHIYRQCMVNFFCDICFNLTPTIDDFKKHCEKQHDNAEGFPFLPNLTASTDIKVEYDAETFNNFSQDEGETIECAPDLTFGNDNDDDDDFTDLEKMMMSPMDLKSWYSKTACPICGKAYSNYHNMLRHYRTHDDSEKNIPCIHCPEKFRLKTELREHLIVSHGVVENKSPKSNSSLPCPECGIIFGSFEEWSQHKETHGLPFTCGECGKQLVSQEELDQHRSVHLNIKVFRDSKTHSYKSTMLSPTTQTEYNEIEITELNPDDGQDPSKKYNCEACNKTYSGYGGLWEHNKRYHPERRPSKDYPRKCKYCDKILMSGGAYYMHKQMHERYSQNPVIKQEIDDSAETTFTCKICFKVFSNKSNLKSHMKTHEDAGANRSLSKSGRLKTYWCNICHQACIGYDELQKHKKEHIKENMTEMLMKDTDHNTDKDHVCDICHKVFTNKVSLKKHKERHLDDTEEEYPNKKYYLYCKYCRIPFLDIAVMNTHIETEHRNETPKARQKGKNNKFTCNLCKKSFETSGALCSHQGWHKRVKYEHKMVYKTKARLAQMAAAAASGATTAAPTGSHAAKFKCPTCPQSFPNDTALQIHILEAHRNINAILISPHCTVCQKDFESQSAFEKHMQLHKIVEKRQSNQQKTYSCKFCTTTFSRTDLLNTHIRTHHRELTATTTDVPRTFKCAQCSRVFEKQASLNAHMKMHDKNRHNLTVSSSTSSQKYDHYVYTCSICRAGFNLPKQLRRHIIEAHPFK